MAAYEAAPFFKGFQEGYLTMDTIGSFVFGLIVINAIRSKGVDSPKQIAKVCTTAGLIAAAGLGLVYVGLAYSGQRVCRRSGIWKTAA
ncbi:BraB [Pontibacter sp. BAB1700]|nr:BraB [Pontibacter sp. BAB1700]